MGRWKDKGKEKGWTKCKCKKKKKVQFLKDNFINLNLNKTFHVYFLKIKTMRKYK